MCAQCAQMTQTLVSRQALSLAQMQTQASKPQLQPVLRHHASHSSGRSQSSLAPTASASGHQGSVMQPSNPASPGSTITTGMRGGHDAVPSLRGGADAASAPMGAASGTPDSKQAPSGASLVLAWLAPDARTGQACPAVLCWTALA